jgi:ribose transport system substrate-binding protein
MIKTAKAYVDQPTVKSWLKEFKVVSTGEDLAAQIAAADNFIDAGYDAVIVNALNPAAFAPVVKRANAAGVVLLSFDNVIESPDAVTVNVDQVDLGRLAARWLLKEIKADSGKLLEVRGSLRKLSRS